MFFNSDTADYLQQIAVFFEVTGIIFASIEIFNPKLADRIEKIIDFMADLPDPISVLNDFFESDDYILIFSYFIYANVSMIILGAFYYMISTGGFFSMLGIIFLGVIYILISFVIIIYRIIVATYNDYLGDFLGYKDASISRIIAIVIFIPVFLFIALPSLLVFPVSRILALLDGLANGRGFGACGLALAFCGVCCEFYQLATLCFQSGCYGFS